MPTNDCYDPFTFPLQEIRAHDAGTRPLEPRLRTELLATLLVEEAEECAWGRRHLSLAHGEALDPVEADQLDELFASLGELLCDADWVRYGGSIDSHLTVTVGGSDADSWIDAAAALCSRYNPGHWRVLMTACPLLEANQHP